MRWRLAAHRGRAAQATGACAGGLQACGLAAGCEEIDDWQEETVPALASATPTPGSEQTPVNTGASPAHSVFHAATRKQASLTPVLDTLADGLGARLWGNVRYNASQGRIEQVQHDPFQKSVARSRTRSGAISAPA